MSTVFLSYKNLDESGRPSADSLLAREVFDRLSQLGLDVFFSDVSLERLGVSAYAAAIDEALDRAKILIAVGTSGEHLASHWVRYEWDSFFNDIRSGVKPDGKVFVYVDGTSITDLPRPLRQTQVFSKAENGLERLSSFVLNALSEPQNSTGFRMSNKEPVDPGVGAAAKAQAARTQAEVGRRESRIPQAQHKTGATIHWKLLVLGSVAIVCVVVLFILLRPKTPSQASSPRKPGSAISKQEKCDNGDSDACKQGIDGQTPPASKSPTSSASGRPDLARSGNPLDGAQNEQRRLHKDNLIGEDVVLAEWLKAENRKDCAPIALVSDGDRGGKPRRATFLGGWAVAFDLPGTRSAYGLAGAGVGSESDEALKAWPYFLKYDGAAGYLPMNSAAGYGLSGRAQYPLNNGDGNGLESLAYLRVDGQNCGYNIWSKLGKSHLEILLNNLKVIPQ